MKRFFAVAVAVATILLACNNDKKVTHTEKNEDGTTTTTSVDLAGMESSGDEMTKKMEEMKKLPPLTIDELKALLPGEINGIKRTNFNANTAAGFSVAEGDYSKDDGTEIKLVIYDCAGEAGAGIYSMNYWTRMNMQSENDNGYVKTIDFMGDKAVESYEKNDQKTTLTYFANNRLLIVLSGTKLDNEAVKGIAKNLKLKA